MIADTTSSTGSSDVQWNYLTMDKTVYETLDLWQLDESDLFTEETVTNLVALVNDDTDDYDETASVSGLTTVSWQGFESAPDLLSLDLIDLIEEQEEDINLHDVSLADGSLFSLFDDNALVNNFGSIAAPSSSGYSSGSEISISSEDNALIALPVSSTKKSLKCQLTSTSVGSAGGRKLSACHLTPVKSSRVGVKEPFKCHLTSVKSTKEKRSSKCQLTSGNSSTGGGTKTMNCQSASVNSGATGGKRNRKQGHTEAKPKYYYKKWRCMLEEEQREAISDLTHAISTQLEMRERLEAIHIINPCACISPTDTEFIIDTNPINDSRFASLQRFVRTHLVCEGNSSAKPVRHQHKSLQQTSTNVNVPERFLSLNKAGRKRKGHSSRQEQKSMCRQLSKEALQRLKEEQSGYFVNEVRVAVSFPSKADDDDDDNVDILE